MAIAPSSNLLSALSQLQGGNTRPSGAASRGAGVVRAGFSPQIIAPSQVPPTTATAPTSPAAGSAPSTTAPVQQIQPGPSPIPSRGGYLGQYVNIIV